MEISFSHVSFKAGAFKEDTTKFKNKKKRNKNRETIKNKNKNTIGVQRYLPSI